MENYQRKETEKGTKKSTFELDFELEVSLRLSFKLSQMCPVTTNLKAFPNNKKRRINKNFGTFSYF